MDSSLTIPAAFRNLPRTPAATIPFPQRRLRWNIIKAMQLLFPEQQQPESRELQQPANISVPFLRQQVGLGDLIAKATHGLGIAPCTPCEERRRRLNQVLQLNPYR